MACFGAVSDRKLVLDGGDSKRTNHHRSECIGEFALEHRPFARDYAMVPGNFIRQERRKDIGQMNLSGAVEISLGTLEALAHYAELDAVCAEDVPDLTQHLFHTHIRTRVAGAVVS